MNNIWWIPAELKYRPETKKWYCPCCEAVTDIERNPEWNGEYRGERPAPKWFVRCIECGWEYYQSSGYDCPDCGWNDLPDEALEYTQPVSNMGASMQFGGNPMNWDEKYHCPFCDKDFWISNGNY